MLVMLHKVAGQILISRVVLRCSKVNSLQQTQALVRKLGKCSAQTVMPAAVIMC